MAETRRPNGRPRNPLPHIEVQNGGTFKFRRMVPEDVRPILGEAFVHILPKDTRQEEVEGIALALTEHYDRKIADARAKVAAIRAANEARWAKKAVVRA